MLTIKNKPVAGSAKNKIVSSDLLEERAKCTFDQNELKVLLAGGQDIYDDKMKYLNIILKHKELINSHEYFDKTPSEKQTIMW